MRTRGWTRGRWWSAALALAVLFTLACGDDDSSSPNCDNGGSDITLPLRIGNNWTYVVTEDEPGKQDYEETDRIVGTEVIGGQTYFVMESENDLGDQETSYIRQSGQEIFARADVDVPGQDPVSQWVREQLENSKPWKLADFDAGSGQTWTILEASEEFEEEGGTRSAQLQFTGRSLGRTTVTVPTGTYTDVYKGEITQMQSASVHMPPLPPLTIVLTVTQTVYFKDGVGVVLEETEVRTEQGGSSSVDASRSQLIAFEVD